MANPWYHFTYIGLFTFISTHIYQTSRAKSLLSYKEPVLKCTNFHLSWELYLLVFACMCAK
jgi:hypothetical protein